MGHYLNETYALECKACEIVGRFRVIDIDGLPDDITDALADQADETREDVEREFQGHIDPEAAQGWRLFQDIAAALRRKDCSEALILLERLADHMGGHCVEEVQRGAVTRLPLFEGVA
jgi:hypothetical protein